MEPTEGRNQAPFVVALVIWIALVILLSALTADRGYMAAKAAGNMAGDLLPGCIALGFWAKRAKRKWTLVDYAWRAVVSLAVSVFATMFLQSVGRIRGTTP